MNAAPVVGNKVRFASHVIPGEVGVGTVERVERCRWRKPRYLVTFDATRVRRGREMYETEAIERVKARDIVEVLP